MTTVLLVAIIAAFPPTLAAVLGYLANRSVRRSIATTSDVPIGALVERLEAKLDRLDVEVRRGVERVARLEGIHSGVHGVPHA